MYVLSFSMLLNSFKLYDHLNKPNSTLPVLMIPSFLSLVLFTLSEKPEVIHPLDSVLWCTSCIWWEKFLVHVCRRIPYAIALKRNHGACAALLNPSTAEPLVWPSPLKFISELNLDAKVLLENALMEANREREKNILKGTSYSLPSPAHSDDSVDDGISEVVYSPCIEILLQTEQ